jgi:ribosomal protein L11 methyltransferase
VPWLQLNLRTQGQHAQALEDQLLELGAQSITFVDAEDNPVLEPAPGETPIWPELILKALFEAGTDTGSIIAAVDAGKFDGWHEEMIDDQDWERAWMDNFKPMRFGQNLWICPSWIEPPDPDACNLLLDPGLAFGTGTHPTTALCLEWLDEHPPRDQLVIDYGCGSGILAVAALKLGARHCWGIDIDPQALEATEANAEKNEIPPAHLYVAEPDGLPPIEADLLIANILSGPLVELSATLKELVRPGGSIVLSGVLADQADSVSKAYAQWFDMKAPVVLEDWVRLEGQRR